MRDYGIEPQVWGGEPNCAHEWGADKLQREQSGRDRLEWQTGGNPSAKVNAGPVSQGAFCLHCNAWRGSLGLEPTLDLYLEHMVEICREIRRVLRKDGTFWLNISDSFCSTDKWGGGKGGNSGKHTVADDGAVPSWAVRERKQKMPGLKPKDLMLIPSRLCIRLQDDGWWIRQINYWAKKSPMPESCTDRTTNAVEWVIHLTKSGAPTYWTHRDHAGSRTKPEPDYRWVDHEGEPGEFEGKWSGADPQSSGRRLLLNLQAARERSGSHDQPFTDREPLPETDIEPPNWREETYLDQKGKPQRRWSRINLWQAHDYWYDQEAVKEEAEYGYIDKPTTFDRVGDADRPVQRKPGAWDGKKLGGKRNLRNFWLLGPEPYPEAHFATFVTEIPRIAIKSGTSERGVCQKCGAGWERVIATNHVKHKQAPGQAGGGRQFCEDGGAVSEKSVFRTGLVPMSETIGWLPTCSCDAGDPVPATCLDPFFGAGTTGLVADQLQRNAIGIELNQSYAKMAENRIRQSNSLFVQIVVDERDP